MHTNWLCTNNLLDVASSGMGFAHIQACVRPTWREPLGEGPEGFW